MMKNTSQSSLKEEVPQFRNYMESLVEEAFEGWLKSGQECCSCERCHKDVKAYALNRLPSKYIVSPQGEEHTAFEALHLQFKTQVMTEVLDAMKIVSEKPRH